MTTLKTYHADEIASALDAQLRDEGFVGLYKRAQAPAAPAGPVQWWTKGPTAKAFKDKADAIKTEQDRDAVLNMLNDPDTKTKLGQEGISDETELQNYALQKQIQAADDADKVCAECGHAQCVCDEAHDGEGCAECADASGLAIAIDFAIRHMVKIADALDKTGFVGVAGAIDETLQKLAAKRPFVVRAALDGVPEHSKGKSGSKVTKKAATLSPEALVENKNYIGTLEAGAELLRRELAHLENEVRAAKAGGTWFEDPEKARSANNHLWNALKQISKLLGSGTAGFPVKK